MTETQEEKQTRKPRATKVTLLKNVKHKGEYYKIGEQIDIDPKDKDSFIKSGIIKGE